MDPAELRKCGKCKRSKPLVSTEFTQTRDGFYKTCLDCITKIQEKKLQNKGDKENHDPHDTDDSIDDLHDLSVLDLSDFQESIISASESEDVISLAARVRVSPPESEKEMRKTADEVAEGIWESMKYRFTYQSSYSHKRFPATRYMYNCAQSKSRQHKPKKGKGLMERDKYQLDTFPCSGWLHITVTLGDSVALVKFKHEDDHVPYWKIDVPQNVQDFIKMNTKLTTSQMWDGILEIVPNPKFSRKAIAHLVSEQTSEKWKRHSDEMESARLLLKDKKHQEGLYQVTPIPLDDVEGFTALAFSLPEVLLRWGERVREISLDSAWNTNKSNFEVFALLGELYGSGCPLGYLLIKSDENAVEGGKERFITQFLRHFKTIGDLQPIATLTDKDFSEINAFRSVFPDAKHQLCFWHCLRAIKTRLAILRRRPKDYDVLEAIKEFPYISRSFVPIGQSKETNPDTYVAPKATPRVTVRFNGELQNQPPKPSAHPPRLILRLNGRVRTIVALPKSFQTSPIDDPVEEDGNSSDVDVETDDTNDLRNQVDQLFDKDDREEEDGPDWMFEKGELTSKDPAYVFCPAPHRKQLLRLFTKHFCQHPIFLERDGQWDASRIWEQAVFEMYDFCFRRGLREVWGYMWTSWYSRKIWSLWARSTSPYLTRLRTTMNVENFWRQLKHDYLHHVSRPRLDQLVWILVNRVTPSYISRSENLNDEFRIGRSKKLTTYQVAFKKSWKELQQRSISDKGYQTDVPNWNCTCGQQKYHAQHLCKHLVHAVGTPHPDFWREVYRRRVAPIYRHSALVASSADQDSTSHISGDDGSITDGDDHVWTGGNRESLGQGGWRDILADAATLSHSVDACTTRKRDRSDEAPDKDDSLVKKPRNGPSLSIIDLSRDSDLDINSPGSLNDHSSSPGFEEIEPPQQLDSPLLEKFNLSSTESSPSVDYGSGDEAEIDEYEAKLMRAAQDLEDAATIIRSQIPLRNHIWMKSVAESRMTKDVQKFITDIKQLERGRNIKTTWGRGGGKGERQRVSNTMGFNARSGS
ncbi:hypothetical protein H0H93_004170 [Arthromyces matolae]|nr:hypothetical protein H0H93_004170 [Arthromyces matolae]